MELNNMKDWAIEFMGTLIVTVAWLWTNGNPYICGLAYTGALLIARPISGGYFNVATTLASWALGKLTQHTAVQYSLAQIAGAALAVVATPVLGVDGVYNT